MVTAQHGATVAFGKLYNRYVDVVFRYVLFRVGDRELAEDVTSETFLRALRRVTAISDQGSDVDAWLVTIARNLVLDHVKSSQFRLEVTTSEIRDTQPVQAGPEQQVLSKVTAEALLGCVERLTDDQRECVVLRFPQSLSISDTAMVMNRNQAASEGPPTSCRPPTGTAVARGTQVTGPAWSLDPPRPTRGQGQGCWRRVGETGRGGRCGVSIPADCWLWPISDDHDRSQGRCRTRMRSRSKLARPNIWRLIILIRLTWPSTGPEL